LEIRKAIELPIKIAHFSTKKKKALLIGLTKIEKDRVIRAIAKLNLSLQDIPDHIECFR